MHTIQDSVLTPTHCYHCGNECPEKAFEQDDHSFCCEGCRTVYDLLSQNNLCRYYTLEDQQVGISPSSSRFEFLDHAEVSQSLLDFQNDTQSKVTFYIPSIHCSSCLYLLEHLNRLNPAVLSSRVDFLKKQVSVSFSKEVTLRQLAELLTSIGYEPLISLQDVVKEQQNPGYRNLLSRVGVAGFCAGNIMLFSFPEYLGLEDASYKILFGWLSLVLSIPVVFYSGWEYFESVYKSLRAGRLNLDFPILLGILVAWLRSVYEVIFLHQNGYFDSLTGLTFFLLAGKWFQQKTYSFLSFERDYKSYFPLTATLAEASGSTLEVIPVQQLQKGNRIRIRHGELIPADGLLYRGSGLIDYSFVTGEALPEPHQAGDLVYAGGRQMGDSIEMEVLKNVSQSTLTQLWNHASFSKNQDSVLKTFADQVGNYFTISVLILASLTAGYWYFHDPSKVLNAFTAVLIIACPCALALSYPFALGHGLRMLGLRKLYLKNAEVIEQMAQCDTIVFDKTGTLTTTEEQPIQFIGLALSPEERRMVASLVQHSNHPLSIKIQHFLHESYPLESVENFASFTGKGLSGTIQGHAIKIGSASWAGANVAPQEGSTVFVSVDQICRGYFLLHTSYRQGLDSMLTQLRPRYQLYLLSGDSDSEKMALQQWFSPENMRFRMKPEDKLAFIEQLQKAGKRVMMLGDGLNDAGALKQAHVGIALTDNTLHFSPASDGILEASQLRNLPKMLKFSRMGLWVIRFSFLISLIYNFIGLSYGLTGHLAPIVAAILMPVSSATMVFIATLGMNLASRRHLPQPSAYL
ncbi:heavy metal translocating P-type ATPase metal-binding domain-containing protein [Siphonobacter sp. SORGH_AS_0500]|uniref:heavy metal translocating P-type ATPase n=1 Tax=Siphonobacter sp. SORGH_AS_0500 TaxID=1864824 RepID=UPI002864468A|nr:heavy metal translocating P-type ATPase metal-binding domain-containing protein [Siphonobacter sp. SORGH_AS_0500]MDR6196605.1 Cu+-exporting ATPase [Siphonobacter sp. SORGH_AS_0500]